MKTFFYLALFLFCLSTYSCKKCQTCNVIDTSDGDVVFTYPEECGKKKELEENKKQCENELTGSSFDCVCSS